MPIARTEITISKQVTAQTEDAETYVVPSGEFRVTEFEGEGAFSQNSAVILFWDYGGAGEEIIWTIKGASKMPFHATRTGDGVKKLAVCLDNGESGNIFLSGHAKVEQG